MSFCLRGMTRTSRSGFTLVELLALCLLLISLSFLFLPALARARQKSVEASCQCNLRQIGLALQDYSSSHDDLLPGPVFGLVDPRYDITSTNQLAWFISQRIGSAPPSPVINLALGLTCPAAELLKTQPRSSYTLNEGRSAQQGLPGAPFGRPVAPLAQPLKISVIASSTAPGTCVAVADADKANVNPTLAGWSDLPYRPVHGKARNQLFFDWHVASKRW